MSEFIAYKWRWVNLFFFCSMTMMQNFLVFGLAPIATTAIKYFEPTGIVDEFYINLLNAVTLMTAVPLFLIGPKVIGRYSLRTSITFLCISDCVGSILRFLGSDPTMTGYWLIFSGQTVVSLGQMVSWGGSTKLSMTWFPEEERPLATSLSSMSNLFGIGLSYIFSPIIVPDDDPSQVEKLLLVHMSTCCSLGVLTLLLFRSNPPTPASRSSMNLLKSDSLMIQGEVPESYCSSLKQLLTNRSFVLLAIIFGCGFGFFNGLFTVLNQMMTPQGYSSTDVGLFGVLVIACGVVGAAIFGGFVGRTHRYKEMIVIMIFLATIVQVWFVFAVKPDNKIAISISLSLIGFFALALTPVFLEAAVEYTYPIPESFSTGILCAWGSFIAVFFIVIMSSLIDEETGSSKKANWLGVCGFGVAFILSIFLKTDYKRHEYDRIG